MKIMSAAVDDFQCDLSYPDKNRTTALQTFSSHSIFSKKFWFWCMIVFWRVDLQDHLPICMRLCIQIIFRSWGRVSDASLPRGKSPSNRWIYCSRLLLFSNFTDSLKAQSYDFLNRKRFFGKCSAFVRKYWILKLIQCYHFRMFLASVPILGPKHLPSKTT